MGENQTKLLYFMPSIECGHLPGSYGNALLGEGFDVYKNEQKFYIDKFYQHGSKYKTKILADKVAVLSNPASYKEILIGNSDYFSTKRGWYVLEPYFGKGILLEDGELHKIYKNIFSSQFHEDAMASYFEVIDNCSLEVLRECKSGNTNLFSIGRRYTLPIILQIVFGEKGGKFVVSIERNFEQLLLGLRDIFKIPIPNTITDHGKALIARDQIKRIIDAELDACIQEKDFHSSRLISILALQLSKGKISRRKILELILGLFFGGHDTTANLIFSSLILLSNNEEIKVKLSEEISEVDKNHINQVLSLPYLDAVIKECLRMYPPVFYIPRGVLADIEISGVLLKKGWHVHLCSLITHRNPEYYTSPNRFKPERFLDSFQAQDPFTFIPFGFGKHRCIGSDLALTQMKIFLFNLFKDYCWKVLPEYNSTDVFSPYQNRLKYDLILD